MSLVDEYDEELKEDIAKLEQAVAEGEDLARAMMRSYGTEDDEVEKVIEEGRRRGRPVHWEYGSSRHILDLMEWLKSMQPVYQSFPFRISMSAFNPLDCKVALENSRHSINQEVLTLKEAEVLLRLVHEVIHINRWGAETAYIHTWYPTSNLMSFVANLIIKYNPDDLLKFFKEDDETNKAEWWQSLKEQMVKKCNIPRLEYMIEQMHLPEVDVESVVSSRNIDGLIEALDYTVYSVRDNVMQTLVEIGKSAVQPLLLALKDTRSNVREAATETLGRIKDPVSIEPLVQLLQDDDLRIVAEMALAMFGNLAVQPLIQMLGNNRSNVREAATETLGRIKDPVSIEPLVQLLQDDDLAVRFAAQNSIRKFGELAVPPLLESLNSEDGTLRRGAANVLGYIGDKRATSLLLQLLRSKHTGDRISALEALGKIGDPISAGRIIDSLKDKDKDIRRLSAKALGRIGDVRALMSLIKMLKKDKDVGQDVYEAIVDIFRTSITKDSEEIAESAVRELTNMLGDDHAWSYASAILTNTNYPVADSLIRVLHSSKNWRIRKRLPQTLANKATRESEHYNEILTVLCQALEDRDKQVKISAAFALENLQDPGAVEALTRALDDKDVRFAAELALNKIQQNRR